MRVTFVYPEYEALGIEYVSAALRRAGHEARLVFDPRLFQDSAISIAPLGRLFSRRDEVLDAVAATRPDLVAFSVLTHNWSWFLDLAGAIRARLGVPIVAGGSHPTLAPERVMAEPVVDFACVGEGEDAAVDLADALARGADTTHIPNIWARDAAGNVVSNAPRALVQDLDSLPFPDKSLFAGTPMASGDLYLAIASRGCAYRCTFCIENRLQALYQNDRRYLRARSVSDLLRELRSARAVHDYRAVWFCDEIFTWNLPWLREFAPRYRDEIGVPFLALVHPNFVNEEVAGLLALAGCAKVDMGVQTLTAELRQSVLRRNESNVRIADAIRALRSAGVWVDVDNIVNLPGETSDDLVRMAEFYNEHRPDTAKFYWLQIYPGTEMVDKAIALGSVTADQIDHVPERAELGSYYRGDPSAPREKRQLYFFLMLLLFLPRRVNRVVIARRLYRWLPTPGVTVTLPHVVLSLAHQMIERIRWASGLDRRPWPAVRSMPRRYTRLYRVEVGRWLRERLARGRAPLAAGPLVAQPSA